MKFETFELAGGGGRGMTQMTIDLEDGSGPPHVIIVKRAGNVVGEITLGIFKGQEALWEEVVRARRLEALPLFISNMVKELIGDHGYADHINTTPSKKREAYYAGMLDGLRLKMVPHPAGLGVPDMLPRQDAAYRHGYGAGECIAVTIQKVKAANIAKQLLSPGRRDAASGKTTPAATALCPNGCEPRV